MNFLITTIKKKPPASRSTNFVVLFCRKDSAKPKTPLPDLFSDGFKAGVNCSSLSSLNGLSIPVQRLIYAERWLNGGSRTYSKVSSYTEIEAEFQPQNQIASFSLPVAKLSKNNVTIHLANPPTQLLVKYIHENTVLFPVHPQFHDARDVPFMEDMRNHHDPESSVHVTPTASTRSVIVLEDELPLHCLKLHCPARISRFNRKLDARDIAKSVSTSRELDRAFQEESTFPPLFGYLPESIGVFIGEKEKGWGYLVREMTPRPVAPDAKERTLLPMFSLYSLDTRETDSSKPLLLVELITKSKLEPMQFILDKVMLPIIESWCFLAKDLGILAQAHGQNIMLEVGKNNVPTRVVFRDLSSYMDRGARERKGLSNAGFPLPGQTDDPEHSIIPPEKQIGLYSLVYDSFLGHHLFDYLAKAMFENYGIQKEILQEACRKKFHECFPTAEQHFPEQVYYYSENCTDGFTQELANTGQQPDWR